ncbi:MAG TPA: hypothetical protein VH475_22180 [Tepidisphaeraceae bacterium]|jgi:hypothetical protein
MAGKAKEPTDAELAKLDQEYAETGVAPEGWVLDVVAESRGGSRWRKADAEPAAPPEDDGDDE